MVYILRRHDIFTQCWFNVGTAWPNIEPALGIQRNRISVSLCGLRNVAVFGELGMPVVNQPSLKMHETSVRKQTGGDTGM